MRPCLRGSSRSLRIFDAVPRMTLLQRIQHSSDQETSLPWPTKNPPKGPNELDKEPLGVWFNETEKQRRPSATRPRTRNARSGAPRTRLALTRREVINDEPRDELHRLRIRASNCSRRGASGTAAA